jgi:phosphoglycerate dehydrogenase-like enzyme
VSEARALQVTRTARARAVPIAEHVLTMTLALLRRLPDLLDAQRDRRWERREVRGLRGATVGIVGAGAIGRATATRFRAFESRVIGIKREPQPLPEFDDVWAVSRLDELLALADVLVLSCPLTEETRHLLGRARLRSMKPTALLVNVARGAVVVEEDLLEALEEGIIAGAALDVFEREPLPPEQRFWRLANVIVSPHSAAADPSVRQAVAREFLDNLERFLDGEPLEHQVRSWEVGH